MTRKGKQPGGHNPLTYHERKALTSYGTATARLSTDSQLKFGDCCLGLEPAVDPVCTPSGHIYSREAIVAYLLAKNGELREERVAYEAKVAARERKRASEKEEERRRAVTDFETKDVGAARSSKSDHSSAFDAKLRSKIDTETTEEGRATLKRTSYWLSEFQPRHDDDDAALGPPPPARPASPMSGEPLRLKDLTPINLKREETGEGSSGKCVCGVSGKALTTQPAVLIKKSGEVMLTDVYEALAKPTMTCPVTGKRFKEKDVIALKKASSGYAASGTVVAKKYRPTLT